MNKPLPYNFYTNKENIYTPEQLLKFQEQNIRPFVYSHHIHGCYHIYNNITLPSHYDYIENVSLYVKNKSIKLSKKKDGLVIFDMQQVGMEPPEFALIDVDSGKIFTNAQEIENAIKNFKNGFHVKKWVCRGQNKLDFLNKRLGDFILTNCSSSFERLFLNSRKDIICELHPNTFERCAIKNAVFLLDFLCSQYINMYKLTN